MGDSAPDRFPCIYLSLFIQIVERLLIEKPDNPIGFIVEYLAKRYPDETRAARVGHGIDQQRRASADKRKTSGDQCKIPSTNERKASSSHKEIAQCEQQHAPANDTTAGATPCSR